MKKDRFEMFTDGVVAIIITLMVLEIRLPELNAANFWSLARHILIYAVSFTGVAITWLNHNNMFLPVEKVNVRIIWVNFLLLFFLSLIPLATQPLGEHFHQKESHMFYGAVIAGTCFSYTILQICVARTLEGQVPAKVHTWNWLATALYALSIPLSLINIYLSTAIFVLMPAFYFIPYRLRP